MDALFILLSASFLTHFVTMERVFYFVDQHKSWTDAQAYCRSAHTDLVTVYNAEENGDLASRAGSTDCVWLGLYYELNTWRWSKGNAQLDLDLDEGFWGTGQPNDMNGNEDCGLVTTQYDGVNDRHCTENQYFLCTKGPNENIIVEHQKNWKEARRHCRDNYKDLATISIQQVDQVQTDITAKGKNDVWIGLYRDPWNAWSDKTYTNFSNWESDPPSATTGQCGCLTTSTGIWVGRHCHDSRQFFCYGDVQETTAASSSNEVSTSTSVTAVHSDPTAAPFSTSVGMSTTVTVPPILFGKQTVLNVKFQSEIDFNNKDIQLQILEQMKNRLASMGVENVMVKWRTTKKISPENLPNRSCPKNI